LRDVTEFLPRDFCDFFICFVDIINRSYVIQGLKEWGSEFLAQDT